MINIIITENQSIVTFKNVPASYENSFIYGILEQAAKVGISIDMIAQSPATSDKISFGFTFGDDDMTKLMAIVNKQERASFPAPLVTCGNVKITVKSRDMVDNSGFASKVFESLKKLDCLPLLITTGIDEISLLIHSSDRVDLERELSAAFG
jgi:aspartokinase